jgi:hypothetical protein
VLERAKCSTACWLHSMGAACGRSWRQRWASTSASVVGSRGRHPFHVSFLVLFLDLLGGPTAGPCAHRRVLRTLHRCAGPCVGPCGTT